MSEEMTAKETKEAMLNDLKVVEERVKVNEEKPVEEPKVEKPPEKGFNELVVGKHVGLACLCEGFVSHVQMTENEEDRWFAMVFTTGGCGKKNYRHFYGERFPLQKSIFRADVFYRTFPFKETPAPEWFRNLEEGPVNADDRRYIAVSVKSAAAVMEMNFVIPGRGLEPNVYAVATELREEFGPERITVQVFDRSSFEEAIQHARACRSAGSLLSKRLSIEERNSEALADWIIAMFLQLPPACSISPQGKSPLSADALTLVLKRVQTHPAYRGHTVKVTSCDGKTITL